MTTLMLVMKRAGNIRVIEQAIDPGDFDTAGISSPEELELKLADAPGKCIGLVDVAGFGPAVWEMCETLHSRGVRFVVLSAPQQASAAGQAMSSGAASFLEKPVSKSALLQLLKTLAT